MDKRTIGEIVSDYIAQFGGSWTFIFIAASSIIIWMVLNSLAFFDIISFDKYPFILLNLVLSFIAAFQAPFIMMSQNRAEKKQDEAYRVLFREIKELVEQEIDEENHIIEEVKRIRKDQKKIFKLLNRQI